MIERGTSRQGAARAVAAAALAVALAGCDSTAHPQRSTGDPSPSCLSTPLPVQTGSPGTVGGSPVSLPVCASLDSRH